MAETAMTRPADPVEFLGLWLQKYCENIEVSLPLLSLYESKLFLECIRQGSASITLLNAGSTCSEGDPDALSSRRGWFLVYVCSPEFPWAIGANRMSRLPASRMVSSMSYPRSPCRSVQEELVVKAEAAKAEAEAEQSLVVCNIHFICD